MRKSPNCDAAKEEEEDEEIALRGRDEDDGIAPLARFRGSSASRDRNREEASPCRAFLFFEVDDPLPSESEEEPQGVDSFH